MISRRISPHRPGRRYLTVLAATGLLTSLLLAGGTALAVHDAGLFELDGNAVSGNATPATDDWDRVCHEVTITKDTTSSIPDECGTASDTTGAIATAWVAEPDPSASIFTGGGSKDPIDISSWAWKDAGGLPDKDNLTHGFAARYQHAPNADCPAGTAATCDILYFGSDRYDNSGDAQQGFWFFQNKITLSNVKDGGGFKFSGVHKTGDLLIISDFSNGGTTSTISVYSWDPTVTGNLKLLQSSADANCNSAADLDAFCGIVNAASGTTAPWSYTDKSGNHTYLQGELYEGGVNLSLLGLSDECFSSVASETRSSTSTTATLKDFVLGQLANCSASLATQVSSSSVNPGTAVHDTATVTGSSTAHTPSGNVTFFMCSFATGTTTACDGTTGKVGTQVGSAVALSGSGKTATADSADVNTAANPLAPGRYCFRAEWPGDANYVGALTEYSNSTECFVVLQSPTTTVTTPQQGGAAITGNVIIGSSVTDHALITGATGFGNVTGSVNFFICNPTQTTGAAGSERCQTGGTSAGANKALTQVAGSDPPQATADSDSVTANALGVWCFRAEYVSDNAKYTNSSDSAHTECFNVVNSPTGTVTTPQVGGNPIAGSVVIGTQVTDHAAITGAAGFGNVTGTVNFFVCNPSQVTGTTGSERCITGGTAVGSAAASPVSGANPPQSTADSNAVTTNAVGVWCFRAEYVSDNPKYTNSSDSSHTECFTVVNSPTTTVTTPQLGGQPISGSIAFGATVTDHAVITGAAGFGDVTGTVNFFLCNPSQTTGTAGNERCITGGTAVGSPAATPVAGSNPPQSTADSTGASANQLGVWCFRAEYVSNTNRYTNSSDSSHSECFTVRTTSSGTSAQRWLPNDRIVVTSVGTSLAGTITVTLRSGACDGSVVYTDANAAAFTALVAPGAVYQTNNTTFYIGTNPDGTAAATPGTYYWSVTFTPTSSFADGFTKCELSTVSINNNP